VTERFYWKARLAKGAPYIGVMTFFGAPIIDGEEQDRSHSWQAIVRTETTSRLVLMGDKCPIEVEGVFLRNCEPISEADYRYLVHHAEWATKYAPAHPDASPNKAPDVRGKSVW
jgi:hypothetical protein